MYREGGGRGGGVGFSGAYSAMMGRGAGPQGGAAAGASVRPGSAGPAPGTSFTADSYNFVS